MASHVPQEPILMGFDGVDGTKHKQKEEEEDDEEENATFFWADFAFDMHAVVHDAIVALSRSHPKQRQHGRAEVV